MKILIIGCGYVGLPLAIEFGKKLETIGFDTNGDRIKELSNGVDRTLEINSEELNEADMLHFTTQEEDISSCNIYINTVPTPIDKHKRPDLSALKKSSKTIGKQLSQDDIVIYESTVYPGATEEVCVPILEKESGLKFNQDFYCGYSPERTNPGDPNHRVANIMKVTSGSTPEVSEIVDSLYKMVITAGTHSVSSIKVAEASKVIENTQRDVNIALINELALICNRLNIDTEEVLTAAGTKWNFLPFQPGIVGGHCIGVDPYYLTHKAIELGYQPEIILAGRRLNDNMGHFIAEQVVTLMTNKNIPVGNSNVLIMGFAFKENCPDARNTRVIDLIKVFNSFNCNVSIYDPWVDKSQVNGEYGIALIEEPKLGFYDAIVIAVAHDEFKKMSIKQFNELGRENYVLFDIKYILNADQVDGRL